MSKKIQSYDEFVEKFKPKKTTDDCYTPPLVYDAVLGWARKHLDVGDRPVVRPFFPGGDYEHYDYPDNCVVIDNPPFSIFAKIVDFYVEQKIPFLLFAPGLTSIRPNCTYIGAGATITYENGATINTGFVTNMMGDLICCTAPELLKAIKEANNQTQKQVKKQLAKLSFPDCILRATQLHTMSRADVLFEVRASEGKVFGPVVKNKKGTFGNSVLLSEKLTAEKLAAEKLTAEKLTAEKLELTEKAKNILRELNHE